MADSMIATAELSESGRMLAMLISNLPGVVHRCRNDEDWTMEFVSDGCLELTGYAASELEGNRVVSFGDLIHADDRDWLWEKCQKSLEDRIPCRNEYRIVTRAGDVKWVYEQARGIYGPDGELLTIEGFIEDITDRKTAEEDLRRAMRELDHRVRNGLSAVLALAQQGVREASTLREFEATFVDRVHALARSHDAVSASKRSGSELAELFRTILDPFDLNRIVLVGDPLQVPARLAPPLAMTVHELATNALKHGSLSVRDGTVEIGWRGGDGTDLHIRWSESGGPPSAPPEAVGVGMQLTNGFVESEMAGSIERSFDATGFRCRISIPLPQGAAAPSSTA